jgi:peptide/nickel transport system ATP-binding protein
MNKAQIHDLRKDLQIIFQDPFASLNPRMSIGEIIGEPLLIHKKVKRREELNSEIRRLMDVVGLSTRFINSYPHELDGGRRQRVGIARALSLNPQFIVCDEPVSSLDVSIQAQVLNLLKDLQAEYGLTYLFITHDLSVVKHFSDKIAVMYLGQLVEIAESDELFKKTVHPYSQALLSAIPVPNIRQKMQRVKLIGELTSPIDPELGCRFAKRCLYAQAKCVGQDPELKDFENGHFCACFRADELLNVTI